MTDKKRQYTEYLEKLHNLGKRTTAYNCPSCNGEIQTQIAPKGDKWDTLSACPHCDALHMKITTGSKATAHAVEM